MQGVGYLDIFNRKEIQKLEEIIKQLQHENNSLRQEIKRKSNRRNEISLDTEIQEKVSGDIEKLCEELVSQLITKYKNYMDSEALSIFNIYFKEKFGMDFERKVISEMQIFNNINESIKIIKIIENYQDILERLDKEQPVNSMRNLLYYLDSETSNLMVDNAYEELKEQKKSIEEKLKEFGISYNWLERHGICERSKTMEKMLYRDTSPQRNDESVEKYLQRILKGIYDYNHAIQVYADSTPLEDRLLYKRLEALRIYLIFERIIPIEFGVNQLYYDIETLNNYSVLKDVSPKRGYEGVDEYIFRILKGISDYYQAILLFANCTVKYDVTTFRRCLIAKGIISEDFDKNILLNDIEKVKK